MLIKAIQELIQVPVELLVEDEQDRAALTRGINAAAGIAGLMTGDVLSCTIAGKDAIEDASDSSAMLFSTPLEEVAPESADSLAFEHAWSLLA